MLIGFFRFSISYSCFSAARHYAWRFVGVYLIFLPCSGICCNQGRDYAFYDDVHKCSWYPEHLKRSRKREELQPLLQVINLLEGIYFLSEVIFQKHIPNILILLTFPKGRNGNRKNDSKTA